MVTANEVTDEGGFASWCVLELLGHRRLGGFVSEQQIAGAAFLRIDIYGDGEAYVTQFVSPGSVYAITPCAEEIAREIGRQSPAPVQSWDLRRLLPDRRETGYEEDEDDSDELDSLPL